MIDVTLATAPTLLRQIADLWEREHPATTTTPAPVPVPGIVFPSGPIKSTGPSGTPIMASWDDIARWEPLFTMAVQEAGNTYSPLLLACFAVVESGGHHYRTGRMSGTRAEVVTGGGNPPSIGILQVVCGFHAGRVPDVDCFMPWGNIRIGAHLLADWIASEGSWEGAVHKWHPGTDPVSGYTPETYIATVRKLIAEAKGTTTTAAPTDTLTFGKVPLPIFKDRRIPDANNRAWNHLGKRAIKGVVFHRQQGNNWGTDAYFRLVPPGGVAACPAPGAQWTYGGCNGLTDWGVDSIGGETLMWNSPGGFAGLGASANRAPHASGPWNHVAGDGMTFVAKFGVDAINRDLVSVEVDGWFKDATHAVDDPFDDAAITQVAHIVAYHADQAKVPHDGFPHNPHTGLTFLFYHHEFCGKNYKVCPGSTVEQALPKIIAEAKAIMKRHQEGP